MDAESFKDERWWWPLRALKVVARAPHEYGVPLDHGVTMPNGDPAKPYHTSTALCCAMVIPALTIEPSARVVAAGANKKIQLFQLTFLHDAEVKLKLDSGFDALVTALDASEWTEVLDPARPSSVRKKKFLGLW
jgi:hypothetical protein